MRRLTSRRGLALLAVVLIAGMATLACSRASQPRGWASPVRVGDVVLVSTGKGHIDGLSVTSKQKLWRFPNDWAIQENGAKKMLGVYGTPVVASNGTVYFGDYNGYLYAFRPSDFSSSSGQKPKAATLKLDGPVIGGLAYDSGSGNVYVSSGDSLFRISAKDMDARFENKDASVQRTRLLKTGKDIWGAPVVQGGVVYVSSLDGSLYAVDANTGETKWRYSTGNAVSTTPTVSGSTVYIGGFGDKLIAVDASTGTQKWSFTAGDWIWSQPLVDGSRVYFGDFNGDVYALSSSDGSVQWQKNVANKPIRSALALVSGTLLVGSEDGRIYGIDSTTQEQRWAPQDIGSDLNANLLPDNSTVYIAPTGCVTPAGQDSKVYYISVNAGTGELSSVTGVC